MYTIENHQLECTLKHTRTISCTFNYMKIRQSQTGLNPDDKQQIFPDGAWHCIECRPSQSIHKHFQSLHFDCEELEYTCYIIVWCKFFTSLVMSVSQTKDYTCLTIWPSEASSSCACVPIDYINTGSAIQAWVTCTFVDVCKTNSFDVVYLYISSTIFVLMSIAHQ